MATLSTPNSDNVDLSDVELSQTSQDSASVSSDEGFANANLVGDDARSSSRRRRLVIVGTIFALCAVCALIGVTVMMFDRRSSHLSLSDQFQAKFTVKSINTVDTYNYNGRISKHDDENGDWQVELQVETVDAVTGHRHVVTFLDGRAYFEEYATPSDATPRATYCYDDARAPPIRDIDDVLADAVEVPDDVQVTPAVDGACHDAEGELHAVVWGKDAANTDVNQYYYCATDNGGHQLIGKEFVATVWDVDSNPPTLSLGLTIPTNITSGEPMQCPKLPSNATALLPKNTTALLPNNTTTAPSRRLGAPTPVAASSKRDRKLHSSVKCFFVHGSGPKDVESTANSFSDYWGSVEDWLGNKCDDVKFLRRDYYSKSWDDPGVTSDFCDEVGAGGNNDMKNRVIFSHGFGNLVVAKAFQSNACTKKGSTEWYAIDAPWEGTPIADDAADICQNHMAGVGNIAEAIGLCNEDGDGPSVAMESMQTTYQSTPTFAELKSYAAENVDGVMCSAFSVGLSTGDGDELHDLWQLSTLSGWHNGFLGTGACANTANLELTNAESTNYGVLVNFLDSTCRYGNGYFDVFKVASPCLWYAQVTTE